MLEECLMFPGENTVETYIGKLQNKFGENLS